MCIHMRSIAKGLSMTRQLRLIIVVALIGLSASWLMAQDKPAYYTPSDRILILGAVPRRSRSLSQR